VTTKRIAAKCARTVQTHTESIAPERGRCRVGWRSMTAHRIFRLPSKFPEAGIDLRLAALAASSFTVVSARVHLPHAPRESLPAKQWIRVVGCVAQSAQATPPSLSTALRHGRLKQYIGSRPHSRRSAALAGSTRGSTLTKGWSSALRRPAPRTPCAVPLKPCLGRSHVATASLMQPPSAAVNRRSRRS